MEKRQLTARELEGELKRYFEQRKKAEPSYSVKALAGEFKVHASMLQKIFRGERNLGFRLAREISHNLNVEVVKHPIARGKKTKGWKLRLDAYSPAQVSWINLAILEMLKLSDFKMDEGWIARRLGVEEATVRNALKEMQAARMIEKRDDGSWVDLLADASSGADNYISTAAVREMLKEILEISKRKIDSDEYKRREHGFSIMPVAVSQMPKLKKRIQQFRWEISELAQLKKKPKDEIYCLEIGFFALTNKD